MITGQIPIGRLPVDYVVEGGKSLNDLFNRLRQEGMQQQQINETMRHNKASIGLQGAAGNRAERALQSSLQSAQDAHMINQLKYDPEAFGSYINKIMEQANPGSPQQPMDMPGSGSMQQDAMTQDDPWGASSPQAQYAFKHGLPVPAPAAPQMSAPEMRAPSQNQPPKMDWSALAKNPVAVAMLKHAGIDLTAMNKQTPEERAAQALDVNQKKLAQKEEFDKAKEMRKIKNELPLTNAMKTQLQNIVAGVPKVTKKIDDLIKAPSPTTVVGFKPNERANHASLVLEAAESYAKAKGWPNTNESIKAAREILDRHMFESDAAYRKRLNELKGSLHRDLKDAHQTLRPGENTPDAQQLSHDFSSMSDEELRRIASGD